MNNPVKDMFYKIQGTCALIALYSEWLDVWIAWVYLVYVFYVLLNIKGSLDGST